MDVRGVAEIVAMMIDPPSGWQFGFPKVYDKEPKETKEAWLLRNGYPKSLIDRGMHHYCRYWDDGE